MVKFQLDLIGYYFLEAYKSKSWLLQAFNKYFSERLNNKLQINLSRDI